MTDRRRARALATSSTDPVTWFDELYQEAAAGQAVVPWADLAPNPHLVAWLDRHVGSPAAGRALDIGCGYGDNAAELARRGFSVEAFDVSAAAVAEARTRFAESSARFSVQDVRSLPEEWSGAFDLVVEVYTLQVLPPEARGEALTAIARLVAPGGTLLVIARGRDRDEPAGEFPWPLTRAELEPLSDLGLDERSFEDFQDNESPPVRRFRATWKRTHGSR